MSVPPSIESIFERLKKAQQETQVVLTIDERPNILEMDEASPPESCWEGRRSMDRFLDEGIWRTDGPGFRRLREWVEIHWNPEEEKPAPSGTVATGENWGIQRESQLDTTTATRKLIAAARLYGRESVGKYAAEFAVHGMIEVNRVYLLKGPPIEMAKPLDEYCTLLPYCEARRKIDAESNPGDLLIKLPEPHVDNVCALESRWFERRSLQGDGCRQYTSPLLKDGLEQLALLLGLVWGNGFRVFGNWRAVTAAAVAALPFRHETGVRGAGSRRVALALHGYGPPPQKRPLAIAELHDLTAKYSELPEQARRRLGRAIARLRNGTERVDEEDRVIDLGIALNILFTENGEWEDRATLIPKRAAWQYADSENERRQTEDVLGRFCDYHSEIVHGRVTVESGAGDNVRNVELVAEIDNVLRTCLKTMILESRPEDWSAAERSALRLYPPRTESDIPSVKSDSLSWSLEEQRKIDRVLEAVWKPVIEEAPPLPSESSSIVGNLVPELVECYRKQGIPYVVIHPARLYMAHPKWPKSPSDPFDERSKYYCERDVERHTRQWREAAANKGLVQFEVPTDADMYHPSRRDDWPQPLLSSHEEDPSVRIPDQHIPTGEAAGSLNSTESKNAEGQQRSAAEEMATAPSSELPKSTVAAFEREWFRLWQAFRHDVTVATNSLLYMLEGIHASHLGERQRLLQARDASDSAIETLENAVRVCGDTYFIPAYPKLRAFPTLTGEPLFGRTAPGGPMEQIAFKGWISEVWDRWESYYRTQLKHESQYLPGAIRPRQQVLGDLRHIRNNLLHNGIAKKGEAASCEVLRWFKDGERMKVRLRHVFDFLNQMGWLNENSFVFIEERGTTSSWHIDRTGEPEEPAPSLISVRPLVYPEEQDPRYQYAASIVFENGVFGRIAMGPEKEETEAQAKDRTRKWMKMTVNEKGDLYVPDLGTVSAAKLYWNCLKGERNPGPGIWEPSVQFRE
ncbi:MAG: hypothetical protein OXE44_01580 [Nitrospinae bacterium]|nr:hypothetical protein [Nitrospinota bacterium]